MDRLNLLRDQINTVDESILKLLSQRRHIALEIAEFKFQQNLPVLAPKREADMNLVRSKLSSELTLDPQFVSQIFKLLIDYSIITQNKRILELKRSSFPDSGKDLTADEVPLSLNIPLSTVTSEIVVGADLTTHLTNFLKSSDYSKIVAVVCQSVIDSHLLIINELISGIRIHPVKGDESEKSLEGVSKLWNFFSDAELDRKSLIIVIGGGATSDLVNFAACTYQRGINTVQIPTTLLSQVDASVGGKNGINFSGVKNLIGAFLQPKKVFIDIRFLESLSRRDFVAGIAEMLKHGLIFSGNHFKNVINFDWANPFKNRNALAELIKESVAIKCEIVKQDPYESNLRKLLNFGHTVGHALEAYFHSVSENSSVDYLNHGEAVGLGMLAELKMAKAAKIVDSSVDLDQVGEFLKSINLPTSLRDSVPISKLARFFQHDKKRSAGCLKFSVISCMGRGVYDVEFNAEIIQQGLEYIGCENL